MVGAFLVPVGAGFRTHDDANGRLSDRGHCSHRANLKNFGLCEQRLFARTGEEAIAMSDPSNAHWSFCSAKFQQSSVELSAPIALQISVVGEMITGGRIFPVPLSNPPTDGG